MLRQPQQLCAEPGRVLLGCPRAGHGCSQDHEPPSLAAGWELMQRDWGLRQREPRPASAPAIAIKRTAALVVRLARAVVELVSRPGGGGSGTPRSSAPPA